MVAERCGLRNRSGAVHEVLFFLLMLLLPKRFFSLFFFTKGKGPGMSHRSKPATQKQARLGMPAEQKSIRHQEVIQAFNCLFLGLLIKINQKIAAKNHIIPPHAVKETWLQDITLDKTDFFTDHGVQGIPLGYCEKNYP